MDNPPSEQVGRDTFERYKEQAKAACLASLEILEQGEVNKVYCEWQDDYVVRKSKAGKHSYSFYQVKTNKQKSKQWSVNELFGFYHKTKEPDIPKSLRDSFVGKLLKHTVTFEDACESVVFLTNKSIGKAPTKISEAITNDDGKNSSYKKVLENFLSAFDLDEQTNSLDSIKEKLKKLSLKEEQHYLDSRNENFEPLAHKYIYKYSEIELTYIEATEIIHSLLRVVESKSSGKLDNSDINPKNINARTAIELPELLNELSISKKAYDALLKGGDKKAIKTASTLNRILKKAGFKDSLVEQAAIYKSKWDTWYRIIRHTDHSCELEFLTDMIADEMKQIFEKRKFDFKDFLPMLKNVSAKLVELPNIKEVEEDILLGGFFSILVTEY
jgi:hypothetical protein